MILPSKFGGYEFQAVGSLNEEQIERDFAPLVTRLHNFLNQVLCLRNIHEVRRKQWMPRGKRFSSGFGTFATEPGHWYTYNHGGRTEAQFNIGMFPEYLRVGLGFEMTLKKGGDPAKVQALYAVFADILKRQRDAAEEMRRTLDLEVEWVPMRGGGLHWVAGEMVVPWLIDPGQEASWIFVGRLLRRENQSALLESPDRLAIAIEEVLCALRPYWEETNQRGYLMLRS